MDQFIDAPGERPLYNWFSGIGKAILGRNGRFNFNRSYQPINPTCIPIDVSFNDLFKVAQNVPHLNVVISKGAEMFSNMEICHYDKNGEKIENSEILKLLNKPNPLQSLEAWLYEFYINNAIYSTNFGYKLSGSKLAQLPKVIWWLPPGYIKINATGKLYRQTSIDGIIKNYELQGDSQPFMPDEIIHIIDGLSQTKLNGTSRIESLQMPLSNIMAALKSNHIILTERGMIGFISRDSGDTMNSGMPLTDAEKKQYSKKYQEDNDLDARNGHVGIFTRPMKWVPMTFNVSDLKLYEGLEDSFGQICGAYGIDRDIFPSTKGATFENKNMGLKSTIQNTMQPLGTKLCNILAEQFGATAKGETLEGNWQHMPVMQDDELKEYQAKKAKIEGLSIMLKDGVISHEEYAAEMDIEYSGTGIITQNTPPKNEPTNQAQG